MVFSFFDCKYNRLKQLNRKSPSGSFACEKTFSLALAEKLINILRVGYSNPNDAFMHLISVLACLCRKCIIFSVMVFYLTPKRMSQFMFAVCWIIRLF